jgi:putative hydrolase of the HAD superfamily
MVVIKALLFDADGVIQRPPSTFGAQLAALLGSDRADVQALIADVFAAEEPALAGASDFGEDLAALFTRHQIAARASDALDLWKAIEIDPDMQAAVTTLRASGLCCCLATNQHASRGRYMSSVLGYHALFDREFYSYQLGFAKPDHGYFRAIVDALEIAPEQLLFIDDHAPNIEGAREVGLNAELFTADATHGLPKLRAILAKYGIALPR